MRQSFKERHGYKGIETAYNGLLNWLDNHYPTIGNHQQRSNHYSRLIIAFAVVHIEGFVNKGHLDTKAQRAAKMIERKGLFSQFTQYIKNLK